MRRQWACHLPMHATPARMPQVPAVMQVTGMAASMAAAGSPATTGGRGSGRRAPSRTPRYSTRRSTWTTLWSTQVHGACRTVMYMHWPFRACYSKTWCSSRRPAWTSPWSTQIPRIGTGLSMNMIVPGYERIGHALSCTVCGCCARIAARGRACSLGNTALSCFLHERGSLAGWLPPHAGSGQRLVRQWRG